MKLLTLVLGLGPWMTVLAQDKPLYTAPLGMESYTFRNSFPHGVDATLDTIQQLGFTEIEGLPKNVDAKEYRKLCDAHGLAIISDGCDYSQLEKNTKGVIDEAKILGASYVMCAWIPHRGNFTFDDAVKAAALFNKAGQQLKENGITFCYHVHGYEFQPYEKGTLLDYLIEHTDSSYVSFEMDILWTHFGGGDPVALLKKYGSRWKLMHLKDLRKGTKKNLSGGTSTDNDVALGTGEIDIPAILREAKKAGITHYFIEDESSHVMQQVPVSIRYLKSLKE